MLEDSQNKTYRILLTENQGKGFSELTVQEILKQILPQLAQIHASGQAHGSISLDTITQVNNTAQLAPSYTPLLANSAVIIKDISDLGRVLAELLSGQMGIQANLEDYCMVSDQTLDLVNAMMRNSITGQYRNANDVLLQLYPHLVPTQYPQTIVPTPIYTPNPTSLQYGQPTQIQQSVTPVIKRKPHTILTIIFGFIFGLGAIAIYLFIEDYLSKKSLPFISPSPVATTNNSPPVIPTPTQPQPVPIPPTVNQVQPSPIITPLPTPSAITDIKVLDVDTAKKAIQSLYVLLSNRAWADSKNLIAPELYPQFEPDFFKQFKKVSVENLNIDIKTDTLISFVGTNTYFYPDGTTQTEERSYMVKLVNNKPLISSSSLVRVIKGR